MRSWDGQIPQGRLCGLGRGFSSALLAVGSAVGSTTMGRSHRLPRRDELQSVTKNSDNGKLEGVWNNPRKTGQRLRLELSTGYGKKSALEGA